MIGLHYALAPRSIAVVGASENPNKIGGRPISYLARYGFKGKVYPVNPNRNEVQGHRSFRSVDDLPEAPDLAIIAVPAEAAAEAVDACANAGTRIAVVMSSGFAETGAGAEEAAMATRARQRGMRIVGPNSQGLANFATGAIASFSTTFSEVEAKDGPVAIVAQSGAMSVLPYALLRRRGIGVRYAHAIGNESDLTVADFALAAVEDETIRLLLLYVEQVRDPATLARAARLARERDLPIIAIKAGRTEAGHRAASSHTGALAGEDRVVGAFLQHHGIWRADTMRDAVNAAELYLKNWRPRGRRLVAISNSGASCVMAADTAERLGLELPALAATAATRLREVLPGFATAQNPLDLTAMLLQDSSLLGRALPALAAEDAADMFLLALPIAGAGYDVPRFAQDLDRVAKATGKPTVVATPLPHIQAEFAAAGVPCFEHEADAVAALHDLAAHTALMRRTERPALLPLRANLPPGQERFLNEAESLAVLTAAGFPVVPHRLCHSAEEVLGAYRELGPRVVLKACAASLPHKSEHGLVHVGLTSAEAVQQAFDALEQALARLGVAAEGFLVAAMVTGGRELMLGARDDAIFGPVIVVGDGGKYVEALGDTAVLLHPVTPGDAKAALCGLRIGPVLAGVRGEAATPLEPVAAMASRLGAVIAGGGIASIDINPIIGGVIVDALIERKPV
jgi:acetate---CoA ligase (ADP-forming)